MRPIMLLRTPSCVQAESFASMATVGDDEPEGRSLPGEDDAPPAEGRVPNGAPPEVVHTSGRATVLNSPHAVLQPEGC